MKVRATTDVHMTCRDVRTGAQDLLSANRIPLNNADLVASDDKGVKDA